jgi:hypothetical protein
MICTTCGGANCSLFARWRFVESPVPKGEGPGAPASSLWSVSHWEYKPYLLNGEPVEVETTVNVIYSLGN